MSNPSPMLNVRGLCKDYPGANGQTVRAVNDVSFSIDEGEVLGVVGESGCGKSTLGRSILRLIEPTSGSIEYQGRDLMTLGRHELKAARQNLQIIFQDPFGSLNPRHRVGSILAEPLQVHQIGNRSEQQRRVAELLDMVGLPQDSTTRFPHEFSGGQRQRIAIARALALEPEFLVADEAVSALDVSIQSQIINLLSKLQKQLGITVLFISHDLSVIRHVSDRIAVMYLGRFVETGAIEDILDRPQHPYTQALVSAVPNPAKPGEQRIILQGELPDPANPPAGCHFNTRCQVINSDINPAVRQQCLRALPELAPRRSDEAGVPTSDARNSRILACHLYKRV